MYNLIMIRNKLKQELEKLYISKDTVNSILNGRRRPNYKNIISLNKSCKIPFTAWLDIKSYLQDNSTAKQTTNAKLDNKA